MAVNELRRVCAQCGKEKKLNEFGRKQAKCKVCISANKKAARKNPETGDKIREKNNAEKRKANATEEGAAKNRANVKRWRKNTGRH